MAYLPSRRDDPQAWPGFPAAAGKVREPLEQTAGPLHHVDSAVGAREVRVVAHAYRSPVCRPDQAHVHVAQDVMLLPLQRALGKVLAGVPLEPAGWAAQRN